MRLFKKRNTISERHVKANKRAEDLVPSGLMQRCPNCGLEFFASRLDKYKTCPDCDYGFRLTARERLAWLCEESEEWFKDIQPSDPLHFPNYEAKVAAGKKKTGLNESVWTGLAKIGGQETALAIMDPFFIMGSLGQMTGEKLTRLIEAATEKRLPVVVFTASGGARMQEGIYSLMQMAKVVNAVNRHKAAGLLYLVVLTDPTTGGVTASFASEGDITLAEAHAMVAFAGRRVIEQTIHEQLPKDAQRAETVLKHGFIDRIVLRQEEKETLAWLLKYGGMQDD
ncbi:acetyl-CoA carboxylase, carboxyl transferase subunit beta [Lactobacillus delbrueckii]|uniref:acetyl-CoA carboxylase carboxyltransferase subunit beta n=1 Tax=Lactobacillus TaxID=1578 RepID=UPI0008A2C61C|nr:MULTISPECIES: acetyl-CoA carboxylase carboxyltransferase subunit beta [Lactobacillus]MBD5835508.1 acetyl-CoA carboxylase carboxyl transferase subunit beta [Lactobacillus delbrueckii]OFS82123.1 acetyl-CoA carboxylase subunit beta [Lactobacillus sp. HMSC08B12]GHN19493.1 acetyl-CoA carboxylase, carboxyl transferase subunit beta [Lactobacillus delbrueckii]GHN22412.1 acetyl-CoA carboxylase, carboxyl transferase subunit beta [Lactobacillus delbrueckii]GHN62374.1 acetyl-CoA carboxylase, carboxyl t